jgi:hypothetical protein
MAARLRVITFDCPDARSLAAFYAEIMDLPTRFVDTADRVEIGNDRGRVRLAFATIDDYRPPTWPDPAYPLQLHLDIPAFDADRVKSQDEAIEPAWFSPRWHARVLDLGARRLPHLGGGCPVYADPAGHVFCLCAAPPPSEEETPAEPHAVLDCFNSARDLAAFYAELLQMHHRVADSPGWVIIKRADGQRPGLSFGEAAGNPPRWQDPDRPQQGQLEIETDDLQATGELALRLGAARLAPAQSDLDVLADPEGHPFCLRPVG